MSSQHVAPTPAPKLTQHLATQRLDRPRTAPKLRGAWLRQSQDSSSPPLQDQSLLGLPLFSSPLTQQPLAQTQQTQQLTTTAAPIHAGLDSDLTAGLQSSSQGPWLPELAQIQKSFGPFDLSTVRIHRGQQAQDSADRLSARAFSHGEHIVAPGTPSLRLLAHEAAHTIQQRQPGLVKEGISQAGDFGEHHADAIADRVVAGLSSVDLLTQVAPQGQHATGLAPGGALQRTPADRTPERRISIALDSLNTFFSSDAQQADLPSWQQVQPLLQRWQRDPEKKDERLRIGAALHLGTRGSADTRTLQRAIILIRTAVLRHDLDKAKTETLAVPNASLSETLTTVVRDAASRGDLQPKRFRHEKLVAEASALTQQITAVTTDISKQNWAIRQRYLREHRQAIEENLSAEAKSELAALLSSQAEPLMQQKASLTTQEQLAKQRADDYKKTHILSKPQRIFHPSKKSDDVMQRNRDYLGFPVIQVGESGLDVLAKGGELYIVGHGNFGNGVGSHEDSKDPAAMVAALSASGLPKAPEVPVDLYVWACWGAVRTQREPIQRRNQRRQPNLTYNEPYARRLAQTLFEQGFRNYNVIGFAGTVNTSNLYQRLLYHPGSHSEDNSQSVEYADSLSTYAIGTDDWNRVVGEDWNATLTEQAAQHLYLVSKRGQR